MHVHPDKSSITNENNEQIVGPKDINEANTATKSIAPTVAGSLEFDATANISSPVIESTKFAKDFPADANLNNGENSVVPQISDQDMTQPIENVASLPKTNISIGTSDTFVSEITSKQSPLRESINPKEGGLNVDLEGNMATETVDNWLPSATLTGHGKSLSGFHSVTADKSANEITPMQSLPHESANEVTPMQSPLQESVNPIEGRTNVDLGLRSNKIRSNTTDNRLPSLGLTGSVRGLSDFSKAAPDASRNEFSPIESPLQESANSIKGGLNVDIDLKGNMPTNTTDNRLPSAGLTGSVRGLSDFPKAAPDASANEITHMQSPLYESANLIEARLNVSLNDIPTNADDNNRLLSTSVTSNEKGLTDFPNTTADVAANKIVSPMESSLYETANPMEGGMGGSLGFAANTANNTSDNRLSSTNFPKTTTNEITPIQSSQFESVKPIEGDLKADLSLKGGMTINAADNDRLPSATLTTSEKGLSDFPMTASDVSANKTAPIQSLLYESADPIEQEINAGLSLKGDRPTTAADNRLPSATLTDGVIGSAEVPNAAFDTSANEVSPMESGKINADDSRLENDKKKKKKNPITKMASRLKKKVRLSFFGS